MERTLLLFSLILGAVGLGATFVALRPARAALSAREKPFWGLALTLPIAVFLLTLPSNPPFSAGQGFGRGFVLGAVLCLVAAFLTARDEKQNPLLISSFLAVVGASIAAIWPTPTPTDLFLGAATGWASVSLVLGAGRNSAENLVLARGAGFFAALCAVAALGNFRDALASAPGGNGLWSAAALVLAATLPLGALAGEILSRRSPNSSGLSSRVGAALFGEESGANLLGFGCAALLFLATAAILAIKVVEEPSFFWLAGLGVLTGIFVLLGRETPQTGAATAPGAPLAAVAMLGAFMVAFSSLQGYGAALMLAGAFVPAFFARGGAWSAAATRGLLFGLALVLYRVFASRFGDELRGASLTDNYALFGFLAGALWPFVPAQIARGEGNSPVRLALSGVLALLGPAAIVVFYGAKIAAPMLVGVALSCAFGGANGALWAVLIALSVAQWTGHLLPFAELSRAGRLRLLLYLTLGGGFTLILADVLGRVSARHDKKG